MNNLLMEKIFSPKLEQNSHVSLGATIFPLLRYLLQHLSMRTFLEKCDCLKAALLLEAVTMVKSKQRSESFLPSGFLQQQSFFQGFDFEESEIV